MIGRMVEETAEQKLKRYEYVLDAQADEIDKLRAEIERLQAAGGAHSVLKSIYLNGDEFGFDHPSTVTIPWQWLRGA